MLDSLKKTFAVVLQDHVAHVPSQGLVLDVGCGTGALSRFVRRRLGRRVIGVDVDMSALALAQGNKDNRWRDELFVLFDGHRFPLVATAFDLAFAHEVLEHVSDCAGFLGEIRRTLVPAGWLIVTTPNANLEPLSDSSHADHVRHYTPEELIEVLKSNGFSLTQMYFRYHRIAASIDRSLRWLALRLLNVGEVQPHMLILDETDQGTSRRLLLRLYQRLIDPVIALVERIEFRLKSGKEGANIIAVCQKR